jgi:adenylate cyclase
MEDSHPRASGSRRRSFRRLTLVLFVVNAVILTGLVVVAYALDVLDGPELDTIDARFEIRGDPGPSEDVVLVEIDDVSFSELGETWPFPRSLHAQAVERLRRAGARVIAYDIQFTEPTVPKEDNALIDAVDRASRSSPVVLATTEVEQGGQTNVFGGDQVVRQAGARAGSSNYVNDSDGVIRRVPYAVEGLESFAVVAAEEFRGRRLPVREGFEWIDFRGPPGTIESVPFSRLVEGRVPPEVFRDKVVVIGAAAPSLQDVHATAVGGDTPMSGPEIQANAIATALTDFPLQRSSGGLDVVLIVLLGAVGPGIALWLGPLRAAIAGAVLAALFAVAVQLAFNSGLIVSFLYPLASLLLGAVGALAIGLVLDAFERERVRDVFSRFVPEPVVDEVLKNVDEDLRLGGERELVTVLFCDIRGFTGFAETRSPETVIEVLNEYLTSMTDVILKHGGTLVTFMGDGIMAVFGAPIPVDDHADRALAAAREMAGPALDRFNDWLRARGHGDGFRIGIGLNSGAVMAGNVGSERRLEYTVIGDTTNTASRIEGMTKGTPHSVYVSESTRLMLVGKHPDLVHVDELEVRGRQAKVVIWTIGDGGGRGATAASRDSADRA